MPKYFNMIFSSVGGRIPVLVNQFTASATGRLSEIFARYNVYGGASSITLFPDKLVFDFPQLLPNDLPLVSDLLRIVHDAFGAEFSQAAYGRVDIQMHEHLEILPPSTVTSILGPFQNERVVQSFNEIGGIVEPAVRYTAKSATPPWTCSLMAEQSLLNAAAVYLWEAISLADAPSLPSFDQKFHLVAQIGKQALKAFDLEHADVDTEQR